jgi:hypothetical protein
VGGDDAFSCRLKDYPDLDPATLSLNNEPSGVAGPGEVRAEDPVLLNPR